MGRGLKVDTLQELNETEVIESVRKYLTTAYGERVILSGPFPGGRRPFFIASQGMLVLAPLSDEGPWGVVDFSQDTGQYKRASGGRYAGFNHPVVPLPDTYKKLEGYIQWA